MPVAGDDIITTINIDMQDVAEVALSKTLLHHDADWGCVVLMEVETGEIKVIANLKKQEDGTVKELFNYALAGLRCSRLYFASFNYCWIRRRCI